MNFMKMTVCAPVCRSRRIIGLGLSEQRRITECPVDAVSHARSWFAGDFFWNLDCSSKKIGIFVLFDKILFWRVLTELVVTVVRSEPTRPTVDKSWFTGDLFWNLDCGSKKIGIFVLFVKILFWGVLAELVVTVVRFEPTRPTVDRSGCRLVN